MTASNDRHRQFEAITIADTGQTAQNWPVAEEVPVALIYNGTPHAVMMATPEDLEDFAVGFSLSEGIVNRADEIEEIAVSEVDAGITVNMWIADEQHTKLADQKRTMAGRSGCGLCGIESLEQAVRPLTPITSRNTFSIDQIRRGLDVLSGKQVINAETKSVHAAAWSTHAVDIDVVREDIGRHNALDKVVGAVARAGKDGAQGFLYLTSRCSYEMVQKANVLGVPLIVAISAPTALALDLAETNGMTIIGIARDDAMTIFTCPERITGVPQRE